MSDCFYGISYSSTHISTIVNEIQKRPEDSVALICNQNRNINAMKSNSVKFKEKMKKRPHSVIGVYDYRVTEEEILEDYNTCFELWEKYFEDNKKRQKEMVKSMRSINKKEV